MQKQYEWAEYYSGLAKKLLPYKVDRKSLIEIVKKVYDKISIKLPTLETDNDIIDIDPFTVFGLFNKSSQTDANRRKILSALSRELGYNIALPENFDGVPTLNNQNATFYYFIKDRSEDDIDNLWGLFSSALEYASDKTDGNKREFIKYFDPVIQARGNNNSKITMGLYWIAAHDFINLDRRNQWFMYGTDKFPAYLANKMPQIPDKISAEKYLEIIDIVHEYFKKPDSSYHDFIELSHAAWLCSTETNERIKAEKSLRSVVNTLGDSEESETHYWLFAPGPKAEKWEEFYNEGKMAIGWGELGDLRSYIDKNAIKSGMKKVYGNEYSYRNNVHAVWQFVNEIKVGDVVFVKEGTGKILGRGVVESDYIYDKNDDSGYCHIRKVHWSNKGVWDHPGRATIKTLTDITVYKDYVEKLKALFEDDDVDDDREKYFDTYTKETFLNEVFMSESDYETLRTLILNKKNIILQGAPGVGKTYAAKRLAYSIIGEKDSSRVAMVQFHQSYSYEDFVIGFRPVSGGTFDIRKGPFYNFCKKAEEDDDDNPYFFIIDEINRGNISKIFGELFMLIENDKRDMKLPLMYGDEDFSVPKNVYIIGIMNTADRSLAMLDYALRRRFAFFEFCPAFDTESFRKYRERKSNAKYDKLITAIKHINGIIEQDATLGRGFRIGHSYFCTDKEVDDRWLNAVITYEILPLLDEYWFDDRSKYAECEGILREAIR